MTDSKTTLEEITNETEERVLDALIDCIFQSFSCYNETCGYVPAKPQESFFPKPQPKSQAKEDIRQALKLAGYKRSSPGNFDQVKEILMAKKYHPHCLKLIEDNLYRSVYCEKHEDEKEYGEDELADPSVFGASTTAKIPLIKKAKSRYLNITQFLNLATQTHQYDVDRLHNDDKGRFFSVLIAFCYKAVSIAGYQIGSETYKICDNYHKPSMFTSHLMNSRHLPISYYLSYHPNYADMDDMDHPSDIEIYNHLLSSFKPHQDLSKFTVLSKDKATLHNSRGFNIDERGSDDSTHLMDFHLEWPLSEIFTVLELAEGLFRLRSHKWEHWYELYSRCKYEYSSAHQGYVIKLIFDHGS